MAEKKQNHVILIISNEPWGNQWFIKHHYADQLAKRGHTVYFIDPVKSWNIKDIFDLWAKTEKINDLLYRVTYKNPLPLRVFSKLFGKINDWINTKKIETLVQAKHLTVWQFDPFRFSNNFFRNAFKIYHISDHYSDLPLDTQNIKNSDLLICTGASLVSYYQMFNKPLLHIPHGIPTEEYEIDQDEISDLSVKYDAFIFHAGSINDRLDIDLITDLPDRFPNHQIVFAGPVVLNNERNKIVWEECCNKPNFNYLGTIKASCIKNYVHASSVCILCYSFDSSQRVGTVSSSLKVLHYLAQKKAIVSSIALEYDELIDRLIFCKDNKKAYFDTVEGILNADITPDLSTINSFLENASYSRLLDKIFEHIK